MCALALPSRTETATHQPPEFELHCHSARPGGVAGRSLPAEDGRRNPKGGGVGRMALRLLPVMWSGSNPRGFGAG